MNTRKNIDRNVAVVEECYAVVEVPVEPLLTAADRRKMARQELLELKERGEVEWSARLPKKRSLEQLRKEFANKTVSQIEDANRCNMSRDMLWEHQPVTPLMQLVSLCTDIAHKDCGFENLHTEREKAIRHAQDVLEKAKLIKELVANCKQEDAKMYKIVLNIMCIPYQRVFGDRMEAIEFEGTNLEEWIKYKCCTKELQDLINKEEVTLAVFKYSPV